jgi:hypothetical protein
MLPRGADIVRVRTKPKKAFGRDECLTAAPFQSFAQDLFRRALRIGVRGIEEIHAGIEAHADQASRFFNVACADAFKNFVGAPESSCPELSAGTMTPERPSCLYSITIKVSELV